MRHRQGRSRRRRSAAVAALAGVALAATAGPARASEAGSVVKSAGSVEATLTWDAAEFGVANPRLRIVRDGAVGFDGPIADVCPEGCFLAPDRAGRVSVLHVVDLDRDQEPEVVVDAYSGGAHCCTSANVYDYRTTTSTYGLLSVDWGNSGYRLRDLGGDRRIEMVGSDDVFSYAFASYADSARPPKVLRYQHGADGLPVTRDVTRSFPALVRRDASRLRRLIRRARRGDDLRGAVAAYVADEYLLRRGRVGLAELDRAARRGVIRGPRAYRLALLRFLSQHGYR